MAAARFEKRLRLLNAAHFDAVFKQGKRVNVGVFSAVIAPNDLAFARIGFALAKRQAPHSVQRNRVRRMLREQFRLQQHELASVDMVLMLRGKLPELAGELNAATRQFWAQLANRCART